MKALSLWEPWASLMAVGAKRIETRSWNTEYRGQLLICSAKRKVDAEGLDIIKVARKHGYYITPQYGMALCVVDLIRCDKIVPFESNSLEHILGDYTPGRFAWTTTKLRALDTPFAVKGRQGFFNIEVEFEPWSLKITR